MNLLEFIKEYPDESSCKNKFKEYRDEVGVRCAKCGSTEHYWKKDKEQYECKVCKTRMSLVAQKIVEASNTNELFIEGGATAYDLLSELHWNSFTPIEELASGVVRMQYDNNHNKHITIKPGSYEWPKGLLN